MASAKPSTAAQPVAARCLRMAAKAGDIDSLALRVEERRLVREREDDVLVEIAAAAVNPSDLKAALGMMPYAVFPRTPGRDFAGVVIDGPAGLVGRQVFGSSGDLGIRRDGTHATHLVVEAAACVEVPAGISAMEAAGIGVPFVTAIEGFSRAGMPERGEIVLVMGANGKVGQAAAQIASWRGARVIGVVRNPDSLSEDQREAMEVAVYASRVDVAAFLREFTGGRGADIVFNTVGDPYFEAAHKSLGPRGRQVLIAAVDRIVPFNIFEFYRGQHTYVGVDSLALSSIATAERLRSLLPGFASGALKPFPVDRRSVFRLEDGAAAYRAVAGRSHSRVLLVPG